LADTTEKAQFVTHSSDTDTALRSLLSGVLGLSAERAAALTDASGLFGALPELELHGRGRVCSPNSKTASIL